jgi:trigger factor
MTTSTLTRLAPTQVALEIPITGEELAAAEDRAFRKLVKNVRLPGFRRGKVPRKIFEQAYGTEAVTNEAMDEVIPEVYAKAVREHDLAPVERPKMEILEQTEGRPTRLRATVEVRPEIALGEYRGIAVSRPSASVSESEIDRSLEALARERATLVPEERPAQLGDVVTADYEGSIDGTAFEGGSASGEVFELREGRFVPGFAEGIAGMKAGETRSIEVRFPDDYGATDLAGKNATFTVSLRDVKRMELPALDDAFAQSLSGNQTVDELRADLRRRLEAVAQARARRAVGNAVMERLLEAHEFPLPPTMVDSEVDHLISDAAATAARGGVNYDEFLKQSGKSEEELRAGYRAEASSRVKATLLIEQIAKTENIVATPADVMHELEALSRQYGQPVARIRKALGNNLLSLMEGIVRTKTLDFLVDNAQVAAPEETIDPAS